MKKWLKTLIVFTCLLGLDILTKYLTYHYIDKMSWLHPFYPYGGVGVFHNFLGVSLSFNYVENTGAAWGLFSAYAHYLFYFRLIVVLGLIIYVIFSDFSLKKMIPFCLIITGAIGNILDYIFYDHVVDMIHFKFGSYSYPVFNIADVLITSGILWLIFHSFYFFKKKAE